MGEKGMAIPTVEGSENTRGEGKHNELTAWKLQGAY